MMLTDLLSESYAAEFDECWERERTVVRFGRHRRFFAHSALNALIKQSGTGYIGWLTACQTRRRPSRRGSRLMKPLSGLTATDLGCMLQ